MKVREDNQAEGDEPKVLAPMGLGGGKGRVGMPVFIAEIIEKLNALSGETTPLKVRAAAYLHDRTYLKQLCIRHRPPCNIATI